MRIALHDYPGHPFQMELSRALNRRGHFVQHSYFAGDPGPKGTSKDDCGTEGLAVTPVSVRFPYKRESLPRRYIGDALYARAVYQRIKAFRPDVVISGNAPLHAQESIQRAAAECNAGFVYWVQDLHGLAMQRILSDRWMGVGRAIAQHYTRWEHALLERSQSIVIISPDFRNWLPSGSRGEDKTHVVTNWGPIGQIPVREKRNAWSERHGLADKFVFMYTGTLGRKHNWQAIWALTEAFSDDPDVQIVVAASGANANELALAQTANPRPNLTLMAPQPMEEFADVLGTADVLLTVLEEDAGEFSVPSKVLSYLCAGRPILMAAPATNLASRTVLRSQAGLVVDARESAPFVEAARQLRTDAALRSAFGAAARRYAQEQFDIDTIVSRFEAIFSSAINRLANRTAFRSEAVAQREAVVRI